MSIYEQFIPGQWLDNIDVNDFVNLNKKPFFGLPDFLKDSSELIEGFNFIPGVQPMYEQNERTSKKTSYDLFDEVATTEIKKALKMTLFSSTPTNFIPSFVHPDVRRVALYGTKALIKDKKLYLKTLEKHLQTHEWMERRVAIYREIEALKQLESFAKKYKVNVGEPAQSSKEAISFTYLTILAAVIENPSIFFSLTQLIPFLDIYIESELHAKTLTEEQAQQLMDQFLAKLLAIRFIPSKETLLHFHGEPHFFGETVAGTLITKTTYRFLHALKKHPNSAFSIRVIWNEAIPQPFRDFCLNLITNGVNVTFLNEEFLIDKQNIFVLPQGMSGVISEDILFDAGCLNLEKAFYLALNAGKDVETSLTLLAVTQPTRHDTIEYDEAFSKLKNFLSYALSVYAELMNISLYLNETSNPHALRSSLMSNFTFYKIQFGFSQFERVIQLLQAIADSSFIVHRDAAGWIKEIEPTSDAPFEHEVILAHLIGFIEKELAKIPLYKSGKAGIRIYQGNEKTLNFSIKENRYFSLLPEYTSASFYHSFALEGKTNLLPFIEDWFKKGQSELHLSTNPRIKTVNGVLIKQDEK